MDTSYLTQQVTSIVSQLHTLFDEIGIPTHERDSRESELFASLSEALHNHLRLVASEKNELIEEAQRIITTITQMETSLDDSKPNTLYALKNDTLKITYPLIECLEALRSKHKTVSKLHQERYEQVKNLIQALESYSSHLEHSILQIKLPPVCADGSIPSTFDLSPSYITSVDKEFTRIYEEYTRRVAVVQQLSEEIVKLWAELGTPQVQTDLKIIKHWRDSPEQLGLHEADLSRLRTQREKLLEEKSTREKRVKELRIEIEALWDRLDMEKSLQMAVNGRTRGCGLKVINDLEDELSRLNELKKQNIHVFVEAARSRLHVLWDELYMAEEEAIEFTPMFCDVYSDALLSAHEAEITRLELLREKRFSTLQLIAKHRSLVKDREDLAASSQDASRLTLKGQKGEKRDPTRLLREEKIRKRIAKELPKVEQELVKVLENWEVEYARPFYVFGERYLDTMIASSGKVAPPRSKTPNGLPVHAKMPKSAGTASRVLASREPSALRSRTPMSTMGRNTTNPSRAATEHRSPSRLPARVPLGSMTHGSNSPDRAGAQRVQLGKENESAGRKAALTMMALPPKMRDLITGKAETSFALTPCHTFSQDFPNSGSIVRHMPPEDPYSNHPDEAATHVSHFACVGLRSEAFPPSGLPAAQMLREMAPPSRPGCYGADQSYHHGHDHDKALLPERMREEGALMASGAVGNIAGTWSSRQISGTSTATTQSNAMSGSENWESYDDGDTSEPEPDTSEEYWQKLKRQQQARVIRGNMQGVTRANVRDAAAMRLGPTAWPGEQRPAHAVETGEEGVE